MSKLLSYLPWYERESEVFKEILKTEEIEFDKLKLKLGDLEEQFFVDTATWGLSIYEKELGLPVEPDIDIRIRRGLIKAKTMMQPPSSKRKVVSILKSFVETAEIEEAFDEYRFNVILKTLDTVGDKIQYIHWVVEEFKPTHMDYIFIVCYLFYPETFFKFKKYFSEKIKACGIEDINGNSYISTTGKSYRNKIAYMFNKWTSHNIPAVSETKFILNWGKGYKNKIVYSLGKWYSLNIPTVSKTKLMQNWSKSYIDRTTYMFNKWPSHNIPATVETMGKKYIEEFKHQFVSHLSLSIQTCSENTYVREVVA